MKASIPRIAASSGESGGALHGPARWRGRRRVLVGFQVLVSAALLTYLVARVNWGQSWSLFVQLKLRWLLLLPPVGLAGYLAAAARWRLVLKDGGVRLTFSRALLAYAAGAFSSLFLPGALGADVVRTALLCQWRVCPAGLAALSVVTERMAGMASLLMVSILGGLWAESTGSGLVESGSAPLWAVAALALAALIGGGVLAVRLPPDALRSIPLIGKSAFVTSAWQGLRSLRQRTLWAMVGLSVLFQFSEILAAWVLSRSMGLSLSAWAFFLILPLSYLVALLPISLGGLGVREGTIAVGLMALGATGTQAVSLSFLILLNRQACVGIAWLSGAFLARLARRGSESEASDAIVQGQPSEGTAT